MKINEAIVVEAYKKIRPHFVQHNPRDAARAVLEIGFGKVADLHRSFGVYSECECEDKNDGKHYDIMEVGLTCNLEYEVCEECCCDDEYQSENCVVYHKHAIGKPVCNTRALIEGEL